MNKTTDRANFQRMGKGEQKRQDIIEHALLLAGKVGLEGLSLGGLAASMEISKSGLFAHFKSKEALQLAVLELACERFAAEVLVPAVALPRGQKRLNGLFEHYLAWIRGQTSQGSCIFMALAHEYDDRPGEIRDVLVQSWRDFGGSVARVAATAITEGEFRPDCDPAQFAFEFVGIVMVFQHAHKLLGETQAEARARLAFKRLMRSYRIVESSPSPRNVPFDAA
ncbi:TetR/AcrR family transcriptional regulator [Silvimonas sp.]|uniref:TetR/AcrR family transcriptional regulator n=1 Tax=Silvimonas sp. TaxID=2650811 RepID=UPI0028499F4D|nr:TetR/AcrR family transcriptional regulator [Silvimonas sp.]MDR3428871.1 TetR/AcrR family transcriptional regulator [Silvimonas sp.]